MALLIVMFLARESMQMFSNGMICRKCAATSSSWKDGEKELKISSDSIKQNIKICLLILKARSQEIMLVLFYNTQFMQFNQMHNIMCVGTFGIVLVVQWLA